MKKYEFTPSESSLLFDLVAQCLSTFEINPDTGKHELPAHIYISGRKLNLKVLRRLYNKLD